MADEVFAKEEGWIKSYWRPAMGWLYALICIFDFVLFPMMTMFLPVIYGANGITFPYEVWEPLTLTNGGLIHVAFGAIIGVTAYGRTAEKLAGK